MRRPISIAILSELFSVANKLSACGMLIRAFEAYRRSLHHDRMNGWLLYSFARNCSKLASPNATITSSIAPSRLRGLPKGVRMATRNFFNVSGRHTANLDIRNAPFLRLRPRSRRLDNCFRAMIGLAEIALDEGKLAHVVHNFSSANRVIKSSALQKWTRSEADYFSRLTEDDEYMEIEVSRMNLVEKLERWRSFMFRVATLFHSVDRCRSHLRRASGDEYRLARLINLLSSLGNRRNRHENAFIPNSV